MTAFCPRCGEPIAWAVRPVAGGAALADQGDPGERDVRRVRADDHPAADYARCLR